MRERIDAFLFGDERSQASTIEQLRENGVLNRVHLLQGEVTERLMSSAVLQEIGELATADFVLLC